MVVPDNFRHTLIIIMVISTFAFLAKFGLITGPLFLIFGRLLAKSLVNSVPAYQPPKVELVKKQLLTPNEKEFLGRIRQAAAAYGMDVHYQVAMGALIDLSGITPESHPGAYWNARSTFDKKIVDYVLVKKGSGEVVALVELDDKMHDREKDASRDKMTAAAGYKTLRYESTAKPSVDELKEVFSKLVK